MAPRAGAGPRLIREGGSTPCGSSLTCTPCKGGGAQLVEAGEGHLQGWAGEQAFNRPKTETMVSPDHPVLRQ